MTKNQKIALGCGGAGCLGLIVVVIAGVLIYFLAYPARRSTRDYNYNVSTNRNSNSNENSDFSSNSNSNDNSNSNSTNTNSSSTSASSMSDDDKHRLYQAATQTADQELIRRVSVKIGIMDEDFTPGAEYQKFLSDHVEWVMRNIEFIGTINTAEKARAYVNEHFPE